jgi:transcriptional regulator with XRE-family HTH domain
MREAAGLSLQDVAGALDLRDPELLRSAEGGAVALPAELVLRLAAVLGRDDPTTAMMRLTRAYNPELWKTLEQLGIGKLVVQAGRERELANLYRANDDARRLDDGDFARVLEFTRQAFDMAVAFSMKTRGAK